MEKVWSVLLVWDLFDIVNKWFFTVHKNAKWHKYEHADEYNDEEHL